MHIRAWHGSGVACRVSFTITICNHNNVLEHASVYKLKYRCYLVDSTIKVFRGHITTTSIEYLVEIAEINIRKGQI